MWNALKRFVQRLDEEGRARFARLASDEERATATAAHAALIAGLLASILAGLYFALYVVLLLILARGANIPPQVWIYVAYFCMVLGAMQGGTLGALLGGAQSLLWQGKRRKAGTLCAAGGIIVAVVMALVQAHYYAPEIPVNVFILWALLLFSPGYIAATGVSLWGLRLLGDDKTA